MKTFEKIMEELDWPPIFWVKEEQFVSLTSKKEKLGKEWAGNSSILWPIITTGKGQRGKYLKNTLWHEIAHILWPWRKHWWIYLFGEKMAGGGGDGGMKYNLGHTMSELPSRDRLLEMAKDAAARLKRKEKVWRLVMHGKLPKD